MNLAHQHIVRRLNAEPRRFRLRWVLAALIVGGWWGYCYATHAQAQIIAIPHLPMGAPGTTIQDYKEGTMSENSPGLDIDIRRCAWCKKHMRMNKP